MANNSDSFISVEIFIFQYRELSQSDGTLTIKVKKNNPVYKPFRITNGPSDEQLLRSVIPLK